MVEERGVLEGLVSDVEATAARDLGIHTTNGNVSAQNHPYKGLFVHFDGPDGGGKSSQIALAQNYLLSKGYEVTRVKDPGGTHIGDEIRRVLLHFNTRRTDMSPVVEALLFYASRNQLIKEIIEPALAKGHIVVTDRFEAATEAYQGSTDKISLEDIHAISRVAVKDCKPDKAYFLDVPAEIALERLRDRNVPKDRIESKSVDYHERVRQAFLQIASRDPQRITVIDATQDPKVIHQQIIANLEKYIVAHEQTYKLLRKS